MDNVECVDIMCTSMQYIHGGRRGVVGGRGEGGLERMDNVEWVDG
jgi:hypothetical protein